MKNVLLTDDNRF